MKPLFRSGFRSLMVVAVAAALTTFSDSCQKSSDNTGNPGTNEVFIQGMEFNPGTITVAVNATVTWTNKDGVAHTVTSDTGLFDSGSISSAGGYGGGGIFRHAFTTVGTFPYHCSFHASMTGTVIVN